MDDKSVSSVNPAAPNASGATGAPPNQQSNPQVQGTGSPQTLRAALTPNPNTTGPTQPPPPPSTSAQIPPKPIGPALTNNPPTPSPSTNVGAPPQGPSVPPPPRATQPEMPKNAGTNKLKFVKLGAIFVVAVLILSGIVFFLRNRTGTISSYEECAQDPESVIQETYPEVCVSKNGEYFERELSAEESEAVEKPEIELSDEIDTSNWATYSNSVYGYKVNYPADYLFEHITSEFSSLVMRDSVSNTDSTPTGLSMSFQVFPLDGNTVESVVDEAITQTQSAGIATIITPKQAQTIGNASGFFYTAQGQGIMRYYYAPLPDGVHYLVIIDASSDPGATGYSKIVDSVISNITFTGSASEIVVEELEQKANGGNGVGEIIEGPDELIYCGGGLGIECPIGYECFYEEASTESEGTCLPDY